MDEVGIDGATKYYEEIVVALRSSSAVLLFLSRAAVESGNVIKEVTLAWESGKPVLPFYLESVEIPLGLEYQLAGVQRISPADRPESVVMADVFRALSRLGIPLVGQPEIMASSSALDVPSRGRSLGMRRVLRLVGLVTATLAGVGALLATGWAFLRHGSPDELTPVRVVALPSKSGIESSSGVVAASGCGEWCPPAYERLYPLLEAVCSGTFDAEDMLRLQALVSEGHLSQADTETLFGAYGVKGRKEFLQWGHLNRFFYDPEASSWLPPACLATQGSLRGPDELSADEHRRMESIKTLRREPVE
jgi:hypothetical protein